MEGAAAGRFLLPHERGGVLSDVVECWGRSGRAGWRRRGTFPACLSRACRPAPLRPFVLVRACPSGPHGGARAPEVTLQGERGCGSGGCAGAIRAGPRVRCGGRGAQTLPLPVRRCLRLLSVRSAAPLPPARLSAPLPGAGAAGPSACGLSVRPRVRPSVPPCPPPAARRAPRDTEAERGQGVARHDPPEPGVRGRGERGPGARRAGPLGRPSCVIPPGSAPRPLCV